jgi:hypothetical protein
MSQAVLPAVQQLRSWTAYRTRRSIRSDLLLGSTGSRRMSGRPTAGSGS